MSAAGGAPVFLGLPPPRTVSESHSVGVVSTESHSGAVGSYLYLNLAELDATALKSRVDATQARADGPDLAERYNLARPGVKKPKVPR